MKIVHRSLTFDGNSIDVEKRTAEIIWTTGEKVLRRNWGSEPVHEVLDMSDNAVNLQSLNNKAPLLIDHNGRSVQNQVGIIETGSAFIRDGKGYATVRFSSTPDADIIFQKVREGILSKLSVGYSVDKIEKFSKKDNDKYDTVVVRKWTPHEVSLVVFPADSKSGVRSIEEEFFILNEEEEIMNTEKRSQDKNIQENIILENKDNLNIKDIAKRERERISEIEKLVKIARFDDSFARKLIDDEASLEDARIQIFQRMEEGHKQTPYMPAITGGNPVEPIEKRNEAIANAILHRVDPASFKIDSSSARFKEMSILDVARYVTNSDNLCNKMDVVHRALTTTDFPILLSGLMNQKLRRDYDAVLKTYTPIVNETEAADFKNLVRDQMGDVPLMKKKPEHSEYERGYFSEAQETYAVEEYGSLIEISRKTIINDDLRAMLRLPTKIAARAVELESNLVWGCLLNNPKMGDGLPIFDQKHRNYAGKNSGAGVISVETMNAAFEAMMTQKGLDGAPVTLPPKILIVPAALATKAKQFLQTTNPTKDDDTNPFKNSLQIIIEPRLDLVSKTAWYLATDKNIIDLIEVAYLQNERGLFMESQADFNTDGIKLKCRLNMGCKVIDYRGFYKNEGASA